LELEKWRKLIEQWQGLIAVIGLLLTAALGILTQLLKLDPSAWSMREFFFALIPSSGCLAAYRPRCIEA
jgi:hypothetical protein